MSDFDPITPPPEDIDVSFFKFTVLVSASSASRSACTFSAFLLALRSALSCCFAACRIIAFAPVSLSSSTLGSDSSSKEVSELDSDSD